MTVALGVSQRDRRTLAIGAGTIVLLVVLARGVPALRTWESARLREADATMQDVAVLRAGLATLPALRDSLRARLARLASLDTAMLHGSSPAALSATVAAVIETIADDNSLKITALQLRSDSQAVDGLASAEIRLTGITDVEGLAGFLRAVEGGRQPLVVRELAVTQPDAAADAAKPEALHVELLVRAIGSIDSATPSHAMAAPR
jgi:hypothetical protein